MTKQILRLLVFLFLCGPRSAVYSLSSLPYWDYAPVISSDGIYLFFRETTDGKACLIQFDRASGLIESLYPEVGQFVDSDVDTSKYIYLDVQSSSSVGSFIFLDPYSKLSEDFDLPIDVSNVHSLIDDPGSDLLIARTEIQGTDAHSLVQIIDYKLHRLHSFRTASMSLPIGMGMNGLYLESVYSSSVQLYDLPTSKTLNWSGVNSSFHGSHFSLSPRKDLMAYVHYGQRNVLVVDSAGHRVIGMLDADERVDSLSFDRDGSELVYSVYDKDFNLKRFEIHGIFRPGISIIESGFIKNAILEYLNSIQ